MLGLRRLLGHNASPASKPRAFTLPSFATTRSTYQCSKSQRMSPARLLKTSPEGLKRRKLSSTSCLKLPSSPKMAPLIQEVEEDPATPKSLELTEVESTLRELLLDVAEYIDQSPPKTGDSQVALPEELAKQPIILRFTGGWVRDKLLGVASHDIDVAINKMTGFQFGLRLKEYLEIPGNPEKYGLEGVATTDKQSAKAGTTDKSKTVGGLHKIEANPEKSKHLETVTTRILGLDIDLVNLRKETYTEDSRNPQMEFGTPEEDAMRRDATVNAMFYNINTQQIEDFTGLGHKDMAKKVIRTPLEPYQTFKDDPLRVLRLIRFASRLGYEIDSESLKAMSNADIKDALRRKISRERIGVELEKALQGPDPHEAMRLILHLDLYFTIFSDPTVDETKSYPPDVEGAMAMIDELEAMLASGSDLSEILVRDKDERYSAWILASMVPYRDAPQPEAPEPGRKAPPPIPTSVAREGIKATNKVSDVITAAVRHQSEISTLVDRLSEQKRRPQKDVEGDDSTARDVLGMAIRRWGPTWRNQVMYALLVNIVDQPDAIEAIQRKYTIFLTHLRDVDILDAYSLKPLLDGKALAKALSTPPGPWMKDALDVVMAWQLRHPDLKDVAQAIEAVKQHGDGELSSALVHHFLTLTIRPLFLKAKPDSVTEQGRRKTANSAPARITAENETMTKPWKNDKDAYALDLLRWVLNTLDAKQTEQNWPLLIPPILSLIDDWEPRYKTLGVSFLQKLLLATPSTLLARTGLGCVFSEALHPCLAFLPTLTPEAESVALLSTVYPTLLTLIATQYPAPQPATINPSLSDPYHAERIKALDTVLRKGVFYALNHNSRQYPTLTRTLLEQIPPILNALRIDSVKHLKYLVPLLSEQLSQTLVLETKQTDLLSAANVGMQSVVLNCWPRMLEWRAEIMKGVLQCWIALDGDETEEAVGSREGLRETMKMLAAAISKSLDLRTECRHLVEADNRLEGLFA